MQLIVRLLLTLTCLELFLGGGGRVFEVYGTTIRIILFVLNICVALLIIDQRGKVSNHVFIISSIVLASLVFYSRRGVINGGSTALIIEDIKPLSYFFSILFFGLYINSEK